MVPAYLYFHLHPFKKIVNSRAEEVEALQAGWRDVPFTQAEIDAILQAEKEAEAEATANVLATKQAQAEIEAQHQAQADYQGHHAVVDAANASPVLTDAANASPVPVMETSLASEPVKEIHERKLEFAKPAPKAGTPVKGLKLESQFKKKKESGEDLV